MKTRLLKKWRKICECSKAEPFEYCSAKGDKFFAKYAKYSRHWPLIKVECELNGLSPDNIDATNHPLHSRFAPSKRLHFTPSKFWGSFVDFDFSSLYPQSLKSIEIISKFVNPQTTIDKNEQLKLFTKWLECSTITIEDVTKEDEEDKNV